MTIEFNESVFPDSSPDVWLVLLTIDSEGLSSPIRVVNNSENIDSAGETFISYPFDITLPNSNDDSPSSSQLRIDNVDRSLVAAIRTITKANVKIQIIRAADPDVIEKEWPKFKLVNIKIDQLVISGDLILNNMVNEPFPSDLMTPVYLPGLL